MAGAATDSTGRLGLFCAAFKRCRNGMILVGDDRRKLGVHSRAHVVAKARGDGVVLPPRTG